MQDGARKIDWAEQEFDEVRAVIRDLIDGLLTGPARQHG